MKSFFSGLAWIAGTVCLFASPLSQEQALEQAFRWMDSNPVMAKAGQTVRAVELFPNLGTYSVYVVHLEPSGYLVLNSDDRLPLLVSFSAESSVDLSDDPQNAFRTMLLDYCERMAVKLEQPVRQSAAPRYSTYGVSEMYGPFLETSWNQNDPYNLLCPDDPAGDEYYGYRVPVGCTPTAFAQVLNFHRWPVHGTGSRSYTDSSGSITGPHSADFFDSYDWGNMRSAHSPSDTSAQQNAVAELMYELGVTAGANYESDGTSAGTSTLGNRLEDYFFFEPITYRSSQSSLVSPMEEDLRAGFPCVVSIPDHAIVADGLLVDSVTTNYHINYGWGGKNNGWSTASTIPGGSLQSGVTSIRPQLMAFPESDGVAATNGFAQLNWTLPKRRENEVSKLTVKSLEKQAGTWSSDASVINGLNSGWEVVSAGRSGDCWYSEQSSDQHGDTQFLLSEIFVPDASSQLSFWQFARIAGATFLIEVSVDDGETYSSIYSENDKYDSSWSQTLVSLAAYAGQEIRLRFTVSSGSYYISGDWPGIRIDDLSITSGSWYQWETLHEDTALAARRFSETTTLWDDCDDFSIFEATSTSTYKDWMVSTTSGVASCFYKQPGGYSNHKHHLTSFSTITPTDATRLILQAKYKLYQDAFRVLVSTDRISFTEIWRSAAVSQDWGAIPLDLSAHAGQSIYVRLEYVTGSYYSSGGVWIDSISTQEVTNPELEGQPIHYTQLSGLSPGTYTLAATLTDTGDVEHALGPSFTLTAESFSADADADGLPDTWEEQYFGDTSADPAATASNGINTVEECYIAGLDPTNPNARFQIYNYSLQPSESILHWQNASGRVYSVWFTTNLMSGFQCLESNIPWTQTSFTNESDDPCGYYKIDVKLEE